MKTLFTERLIIVQPSGASAMANVIAHSVDTIGGLLTFRVPLSPTGLPPATHFWCDWAMQLGDRSSLVSQLGTITALLAPHIFDAAAFIPDQVLTTLGLARISSITAVVI